MCVHACFYYLRSNIQSRRNSATGTDIDAERRRLQQQAKELEAKEKHFMELARKQHEVSRRVSFITTDTHAFFFESVIYHVYMLW